MVTIIYTSTSMSHHQASGHVDGSHDYKNRPFKMLDRHFSYSIDLRTPRSKIEGGIRRLRPRELEPLEIDT